MERGGENKYKGEVGRKGLAPIEIIKSLRLCEPTPNWLTIGSSVFAQCTGVPQLLAPGRAKNYTQAVSVHASHPHWTSTTVPVRLCIRSFCTQWQIAAEVDWLSGLRSAKNKN